MSKPPVLLPAITAAMMREDGLLLLLWQILVKLASPIGILGVHLLYDKDLTSVIPPVAPRVPAAIRLATESDVGAVLELQGYRTVRATASSASNSECDGFAEDEETQEERLKYIGRLRRGEICFLVFVGTELVAFDWMCRQWGEALPGLPIILDDGEFYGAEAFTAPNWRGLDLHKFVNNYMLRFAQSVGCHRCYTTAELEMWRSHRNLRRLGYRLLGIVLWFWPNGAKKVFAFRLKGEIDILARAQCPARIEALRRRAGSETGSV